jgi:hypothetical protein
LIRVPESRPEQKDEEKKIEEEIEPQIKRKTIIEYFYKPEHSCLCILSKKNCFWVFIKNGNVRIHSSKHDEGNELSHICDFGMPGYENLFLAITAKAKLSGYSISPNLSYDFPVPLTKIEIGNIRNILAFPYDKPKYLIYTTYQNNYNYSLNLMEIK